MTIPNILLCILILREIIIIIIEGDAMIVKVEEVVAEVEVMKISTLKRIRIKSLRINLLSIDSQIAPKLR